MGIISLLLLTLIPVSLAFAIITLVRMLGKGHGHDADDLRKRLKHRLIVSAAVLVACFAVLLFSGRLYSLSMTIQMPYIGGISSSGNLSDDKTAIRLSSDDGFELPGSKAVTFNENFGVHISFGQEVFLAIDHLPNEHLFRYSDEFIPREYRAASASDVGYIVFVRHYATSTSTEYTDGSRAFRHDIEVRVCDEKSILAQSTFQGGLRPSTTGGDTIGPAPGREASDWVAGQLARLTSQSPIAADEAEDRVAAAEEGSASTWTAERYSAFLEGAAAEAGIELLPDKHNGGTFYAYYFGDGTARGESIDIEEQQAGLHVRTGIDRDSLTAAGKLDIYLLVLLAAGIASDSAIGMVDSINAVLVDLPDDNGAIITLKYPDDGVVVDIVPRAGRWSVNFTFTG